MPGTYSVGHLFGRYQELVRSGTYLLAEGVCLAAEGARRLSGALISAGRPELVARPELSLRDGLVTASFSGEDLGLVILGRVQDLGGNPYRAGVSGQKSLEDATDFVLYEDLVVDDPAAGPVWSPFAGAPATDVGRRSSPGAWRSRYPRAPRRR